MDRQLVHAAAGLIQTLPFPGPTVGVLRGWNRAERGRARMLRNRLALMGVHSVDLSPLPEPGQSLDLEDQCARPCVQLLVHDGGSHSPHALRTAARWGLPLLTPHSCPDGAAALMPFKSHRHSAIGVVRADGVRDVAVHRARVTPVDLESAGIRITMGGDEFDVPPEGFVQVDIVPDGSLKVSGPSLPIRTGSCLHLAAAGMLRLDLDGTPAHDFRAGFSLKSLPGRLHLMSP